MPVPNHTWQQPRVDERHRVQGPGKEEEHASANVGVGRDPQLQKPSNYLIISLESHSCNSHQTTSQSFQTPRSNNNKIPRSCCYPGEGQILKGELCSHAG